MILKIAAIPHYLKIVANGVLRQVGKTYDRRKPLGYFYALGT